MAKSKPVQFTILKRRNYSINVCIVLYRFLSPTQSGMDYACANTSDTCDYVLISLINVLLLLYSSYPPVEIYKFKSKIMNGQACVTV